MDKTTQFAFDNGRAAGFTLGLSAAMHLFKIFGPEYRRISTLFFLDSSEHMRLALLTPDERKIAVQAIVAEMEAA